MMKLTASAFIAVFAFAGSALAQPTAAEFKCQAGVSKALVKFIGAKAKCLTKCEQGARKGSNPFSDCEAPYGGAAATCIQDPVKGAEAKAVAAMNKACTADCPECYQGGDCPTANTMRVANAESQIDALALLVYCDDSGSGDGLTSAEAKCQDGTVKALTKFAGSKTKCYDKCIAAEQKGKLPPGSCIPPNPADPKTNACVHDPVKGAEAKAVAAIAKACADPAECLPPNHGPTFVGVAEAGIDGGVPQTYCGSPSGAFVD
jgi:hypothetical protein